MELRPEVQNRSKSALNFQETLEDPSEVFKYVYNIPCGIYQKVMFTSICCITFFLPSCQYI